MFKSKFDFAFSVYANNLNSVIKFQNEKGLLKSLAGFLAGYLPPFESMLHFVYIKEHPLFIWSNIS